MDLSLFFLFLCLFSLEAEATTKIPQQVIWKVKDSTGNKVCMEMSMSAQIEVNLGNGYITPDIETSFKASSLCTKPFRQFTLSSNSSTTQPHVVQLQLSFLLRGAVDYTMPHITAMWYDYEGFEGDFKQGKNLLRNDVPYKLAYRCNEELTLDLEGGFAKVHLWNIIFKPFAEHYNEKDQVCYTDHTGLFIGLSIFFGLVLIFAGSKVIYKKCTCIKKNQLPGENQPRGENQPPGENQPRGKNPPRGETERTPLFNTPGPSNNRHRPLPSNVV